VDLLRRRIVGHSQRAEKGKGYATPDTNHRKESKEPYCTERYRISKEGEGGRVGLRVRGLSLWGKILISRRRGAESETIHVWSLRRERKPRLDA